MHITTKILMFFGFLVVLVHVIFDAIFKKFTVESVLFYVFALLGIIALMIDQECILYFDSCTIWAWVKFLLLLGGLIYYIGIKIYSDSVKALNKTAAAEEEKEPKYIL
jgi:hypothetical protein